MESDDAINADINTHSHKRIPNSMTHIHTEFKMISLFMPQLSRKLLFFIDTRQRGDFEVVL